MIFDGKEFAEEIIAKLPRKKAKLAIFLSDDNVSGARYVKIKTEVAKRLNVEFSIFNLQFSNNFQDLIFKLNNDPEITGIMIQLPFPNSEELIKLINPKKDVDGLREDSLYLPAVVRAVQKVLSTQCSVLRDKMICVVGSKGFVGKNLIKFYPNAVGMDKEDYDANRIKDFDIIISATGNPGLIKEIKEGAMCIDLGFPKGDFDPSIALRASFFTPVPGGIGPVTVAMLFANLLESM